MGSERCYWMKQSIRSVQEFVYPLCAPSLPSVRTTTTIYALVASAFRAASRPIHSSRIAINLTLNQSDVLLGQLKHAIFDRAPDGCGRLVLRLSRGLLGFV